MNICFLCKTYYQSQGGIEIDTFNMAHGLAKLGHIVHIVTSADNKKFYRNAINSSIYIHELPHNYEPFKGSWCIDKIIPFLDLRYSYTVSRAILQLIRNYKIDIVQSSDWLYEGLWFSLRKRNIPIVVRLHGHISTFNHYQTRTISRTFNSRMRLLQEKTLVRNADAISVNSSSYASLMTKSWGVEQNKVRIIPNGIDIDFFQVSPSGKNNLLSLLYVGRLEKNKGLGVLTEALIDVYSTFPDVEMIFVGLDKRHEDLNISWSEYIKQRLPPCKIKFIKPVNSEELVNIYRESSICIFPSLFEAFGITALEAMSCGRPVIASLTGGFLEIIENNINGILVAPGDAKALACQIIRLLKSKELQERLGRNSRQTVEDKYSIDRIAQLTIEFYTETINNFNKN